MRWKRHNKCLYGSKKKQEVLTWKWTGRKPAKKSHVLPSEADPKVYTYDSTLPEVVEDFMYLGSWVPSTVRHQINKSTGQEINDTPKTEIAMRRSFACCKNR